MGGWMAETPAGEEGGAGPWGPLGHRNHWYNCNRPRTHVCWLEAVLWGAVCMRYFICVLPPLEKTDLGVLTCGKLRHRDVEGLAAGLPGGRG